jgi:hypothetical protein
VRVNLKFADGVKSISPMDRFAFTVQNVRNPQTLKPSDSFQANVLNKDYITINSLTEGISVTTNNSYIVKRAEVTSSSPNPGRASDFKIEFYAEHGIKSGGGILIVYPPQITPLSSDQVLTVDVNI